MLVPQLPTMYLGNPTLSNYGMPTSDEEEVRRRATRTVMGLARDSADARVLLDILGLLPDQPPLPAGGVADVVVATTAIPAVLPG